MHPTVGATLLSWTLSQGGVQPQTTPQGWWGPLHHARVQDNPSPPRLLPPNPQGLLYTLFLLGDTKSPARNCPDSRGLHLTSAGQVLPQALWLSLALGPTDTHRNIANSPTTSPGQLSDGKRPVEMTNYFVLIKSMVPDVERSPAAIQDHLQASLQQHAETGLIPAAGHLHHPPQLGDMLGSSLQTLLCPQPDPCSPHAPRLGLTAPVSS